MDKKNNNGMELSLTEILAVILRGGKTVILVALVCAVLLGGFAVLRTPAQDDAAALASYQQSKQILEDELARARKAAGNQSAYNEKSQLMSIDPYNKITTTVIFAISGIKLESVADAFEVTETPVDYITSRIQAQYLSIWNGLDLQKIAAGTAYEEVEDKYLREIAMLTVSDGGVIELAVIGSDAAACEQLAGQLYDALEQSRAAVIKASYSHEFAVLSAPVTKSTIDLELELVHTTNSDNLELCLQKVSSCEAALAGLQMPSVGVKGIVLYAVIGGVVGALLSIAWLMCVHYANGRVSGANHLNNRYDLLHFGSFIKKKSVFAMLAGRVLGERAWKDETKALDYISANGASHLPKDGLIVVASTLETVDDALQDALVQALGKNGGKVTFVTDLVHNPEAISAIAQSSGVVLAERAFASRNADIREALNTAKHLDKPVYGFVLL